MSSPEFYTSTEREQLKLNIQIIALNHEIRTRSMAEILARLKAVNVTPDEEEIIKKFCDANEIDWNKIKPYKEEEKK